MAKSESGDRYKRPTGKRLQVCLEFYVDEDLRGAIARAGYSKVTDKLVDSIDSDEAVWEEIKRIRKFAEIYYEDFDGINAALLAYPEVPRKIAIKIFEQILMSASLQAELMRLRNGEVELPPQWDRFCDLFLSTGNGTRSYMEAFGNDNYKSASVAAHHLLKNPKICARLRRKKRESAEAINIDEQWLLRKLVARVELTLPEVADISPSGDIKQLRLGDLSPEKLQAVRKIKRIVSDQGDRVEVELPDGLGELRMIGEYLGFGQSEASLLRGLMKFGYVIRYLKDDLGNQIGYEILDARSNKIQTLDIPGHDLEVELPWEQRGSAKLLEGSDDGHSEGSDGE
jgi:hypothetical protein